MKNHFDMFGKKFKIGNFVICKPNQGQPFYGFLEKIKRYDNDGPIGQVKIGNSKIFRSYYLYKCCNVVDENDPTASLFLLHKMK